MTNREVLNSWKEVATYLGRGVRTVQRWEQELSLPVRRPRGKSRSAVIAFRSELDQWLQNAAIHQIHHGEEPRLRAKGAVERRHVLHQQTTALMHQARQLVDRSCELWKRMDSVRDLVTKAVELTSVQVKKNAKCNGVTLILFFAERRSAQKRRGARAGGSPGHSGRLTSSADLNAQSEISITS